MSAPSHTLQHSFSAANSQSQPSVAALHICPGHRKPSLGLSAVKAIVGKGLEGDIHAIGESSRQVLLVAMETLERFNLRPGILKENIATRGISLDSLQHKQRLRIGSVLLEITKPCAPCDRMEEIRPGLKEALRGQRGVLARIVEGGTISVGDPLVLEGPAR